MGWFDRLRGRETSGAEGAEKAGQGPYRRAESPEIPTGPQEPEKVPERLPAAEETKESWPDMASAVDVGPQGFELPEIGIARTFDRPEMPERIRTLFEDHMEKVRSRRPEADGLTIALIDAELTRLFTVPTRETGEPEYYRIIDSAHARPDIRVISRNVSTACELMREKEVLEMSKERKEAAKDFLERSMPALGDRNGQRGRSFDEMEVLSRTDSSFRERHFALMKREPEYRTVWEMARNAKIALETRDFDDEFLDRNKARQIVAEEGMDEGQDLLISRWDARRIANDAYKFLHKTFPEGSLKDVHLQGVKWQGDWLDDLNVIYFREGLVERERAAFELARLKAEKETLERRLEEANRHLKRNHDIDRRILDSRLMGHDAGQAKEHERLLRQDASYQFDISEIQEYERLIQRDSNRIKELGDFLGTLEELRIRASASYEMARDGFYSDDDLESDDGAAAA